MTRDHDKHGCERCGLPTYSQFCRDCRQVDPVMTAGGLTARQRNAKRQLREALDELGHQEILVGLSVKQEQVQLAEKQVRKLRARIQRLEERLAA